MQAKQCVPGRWLLGFVLCGVPSLKASKGDPELRDRGMDCEDLGDAIARRRKTERYVRLIKR